MPVADSQHQCVASVDSIMDYGQYAISQSGLGHIMYSAATAQSTMDFSTLPIEDGVVNSPPDGGKRPRPISSPSPLKSRTRPSSPELRSEVEKSTQRKLYDDFNCGLPSSEVPGPPTSKLHDDSEMQEDLIMIEVRVKLTTHSFVASHAFSSDELLTYTHTSVTWM